jgi:hypothetical protein
VKSRLLVLLESFVLLFMSERTADKVYPLVNRVRRARFNVPCENCEDCGYAFPADDLNLVTKSNGRDYWECTSCKDFGLLLRAAFRRVA